ncbi:MAG: ParB/RepB/Spo0J family partition protein [Vulcanimicrobiaceae bacterium]
MHLPLEAIRRSSQQPRTRFEPAALAELERSIRTLGVLVPIVVRPLGERDGSARYELIAGERRYRAAGAAGLRTIPALVRSADDRTSLELALVENLQRADLDPIEEAEGYRTLIEQYELTQEALAERVGKSRPAVANTLRLLGLSESIRARVRDGTLGAAHARTLLAFPEAAREALAERIAREGLSVRALERLAEARRTPVAARVERRARPDPDRDAASARLRERFGAPVAIVAAQRGGTIAIRYADEADLVRLVELLLERG